MPLKLMIADDSVTIQKVVDLAFEDEDVSVLSVGNGQEALKKANETRPDIIIADTDMPELDGFKLCREIKENENLKGIPVCLLHSDFEEFDEEKYQSCGADGHLSKPFKSEDIINKVAEITGTINKMEKKDEQILDHDLLDQGATESVELSEDLDEMEILPLDGIEEEMQDVEPIKLKQEDAVPEVQENETSLKDSPAPKTTEGDIAKFMEDLDGLEEDELFKEGESGEAESPSVEGSKEAPEENLENELNEFNKALDIPDGELGEAGPFVEDKSELLDESGIEKIKNNLAEETEGKPEEGIEDIARELESVDDEIIEEKEDLIDDAGIFDNPVTEEPEIKKASTGKPAGAINQFSDDEFEKLIGGHIRQVIERTLKEAIQSEISGITDKIIDAVERIAGEITPDISRKIIQEEIERIKDSNE